MGGLGAGYDGASDIAIDLRVDDHGDPCLELERLLDFHDLIFGTPKEVHAVEGDIADRLTTVLAKLGYHG